ncbi:MAG: hypothetical protein MJ061_04290, partial [Mailhella sp.]|nr:hypothetical protein [Mailhella sp.]
MKKTTLAAVTAIAAAGLAAFGAGYGRLALEQAAADALRRCEAAAPVRFSEPRMSLLPPSATVERAVIRGPHGVLELRG